MTKSNEFDTTGMTWDNDYPDGAWYDGEFWYNNSGEMLRDASEYDQYSEGYTPFGDIKLMEKTQVQHLRKGDILSSGTRIIENPYPETHPMYGKNKLCVKVRYSNGNIKEQRWGKYTTVSLMSSEQAVIDANELINDTLKMFEA